MTAGKKLGPLAAAAIALVLAAPAGAATIKVTTEADGFADDGDCSLREAIEATNLNDTVNGGDDCKHDGGMGPDVIEVPDGLYVVNGAAGENGNASGDLDVEAGSGLTVRGDGVPTLLGDLDRVIHVESGNLVVKGVGITGGEAGAARGGGILADGPGRLTLSRGFVT